MKLVIPSSVDLQLSLVVWFMQGVSYHTESGDSPCTPTPQLQELLLHCNTGGTLQLSTNTDSLQLEAHFTRLLVKAAIRACTCQLQHERSAVEGVASSHLVHQSRSSKRLCRGDGARHVAEPPGRSPRAGDVPEKSGSDLIALLRLMAGVNRALLKDERFLDVTQHLRAVRRVEGQHAGGTCAAACLLSRYVCEVQQTCRRMHNVQLDISSGVFGSVT